ncbi:MAG: hypothetical protein AAGB22_15805, partial [Bacteroidota bacterium]
ERPWRWLRAGFWQLLHRFVPLEQSAENTHAQVRVIALVLLAKFIFGLALNYQLYHGSFAEGTAGMDAFTIAYFATLVLIPVVFGLFFKRLKIGWVLLSIVLAYALAGGVFEQSWMAVYAREMAEPMTWWQGFWPATMTQLQLLFNLLVLWLVTRKYLMAHFGLGPAARLWPLITIGLVVINFLLIYAYGLAHLF